jgi:hypothetical protein
MDVSQALNHLDKEPEDSSRRFAAADILAAGQRRRPRGVAPQQILAAAADSRHRRGHVARFVKRYATLGDEILGVLRHYVGDVRGSRFPDVSHTYKMPDSEQDLVEAHVQ